MSPRSRPIKSTFILYSFILPFCFATSCQNGYDLQPFQQGRVFFKSADAPLTKELAKLQTVVDAADLLLTHINRIENKVLASLNTRRVPGPNDDIRPCNTKKSDFALGAGFKLGVRGWPLLPKSTCVSDVFGADLTASYLPQDRRSQYTANDLYEAMFTRGKVMKDNLKTIVREAASNFSNPDVNWNYPYDTPSQRCVLHPVGAYRIGDKWYLSHSVTSAPKNEQLPLFSRQSMTEHIPVENGKLGDPKLMCLPVRPKTGEVHQIRTDATTLIASNRRIAEPAFVSRLPLEENPAILRSLEESDLFVQQAQDALTASNIAILVFPLALNLVPIALLADVSSFTMLIYTLMSDILTALPLGIKGVELISIGKQRYRSVFVRITSATNGSRLEAGAAELHAAECRAHDNVLPAGVVFLVLAIIFMVAGVVGELVAQSYRMKQRKHHLEELKEARRTLRSKGSSKPPTAVSKIDSLQHNLTSIDFQSQAVGSLVASRSYNESYDSRKGDKSA